MTETVILKHIQDDFPTLQKKIHGHPLVYLDNAATTQKPKQVIEAVKKYYEEHNSNVHRAVHQLSQEATEIYDSAHKDVASFINASMEEVIFTKNATEALNLAAYSLISPLKKGDEIVLTQMEHHSNLVPWQQLAKKKGLAVKYISLTEDGQLEEESVKQNITGKTKIVSVVHVSNSLGTINDVKEIAKVAHEHGALCVVDGAQSVPHLKVDMKGLDVDFFAFSGHKMYGPTGIGVLYGRKNLLEGMDPFLYGGDMIKNVTLTETSFNDLPWKFEAGTPNIAGAAGLKAAISFLSSFGMEKLEKQEKELFSYAQKKLGEVKRLALYGPQEKCGVFSFNLENVHPHDVSSILDTEGVAVRSGHHCCMPLMKMLGIEGTARASFGMYNTKGDVDKLIEGLEKVKKVFS